MDEATRQKFVDSYDAMVARAPAKHGRLPIDNRSFKETAVDKLDAKYQVAILLDDGPSYFAHKEILFQILCMDVLAPGRKKFRKAAAAITMSDWLVAAHQKAFKEFKHPALAEQVAKVHVAGPIFFDQIYYPLGGIKAVRDAPTRAGWGRSVQKVAENVKSVLSLMTVYHHHYQHLRMDPAYNRASLNLGSELITTLHEGRQTPLSKRTVQDRWASLKNSAALLYAAESMPHDGRTLLQCIIEDWLTFDDVLPVFAEWIARSRFVASEILLNCSERDTADINRNKLPEVTPVAFSAPALPPDRTKAIEDKFRRRATAKA